MQRQSPSLPQVTSNWSELVKWVRPANLCGISKTSAGLIQSSHFLCAKLRIFALAVPQQWTAALNMWENVRIQREREREPAADRPIPLLAAHHTQLLCTIMHRSGQYVVCTHAWESSSPPEWVNRKVRGDESNNKICSGENVHIESTRAAASAHLVLFSSVLMSLH